MTFLTQTYKDSLGWAQAAIDKAKAADNYAQALEALAEVSEHLHWAMAEVTASIKAEYLLPPTAGDVNAGAARWTLCMSAGCGHIAQQHGPNDGACGQQMGDHVCGCKHYSGQIVWNAGHPTKEGK